MTKLKQKNNNFLFVALFAIAIFCISFAIPTFSSVSAISDMASNKIELTNENFNSSTSTYLQTSPEGWDGTGTGSGKNGVITTNNANFDESRFAISTKDNPKTPYSSTSDFVVDEYVLMLNAKDDVSQNSNSTFARYKFTNSTAITMESYSFYSITLFAKTLNAAKASIYITGLEEELCFENFSTKETTINDWEEYRFYIATGNTASNVKIELCLGTNEFDSTDAVFFDDVNVFELSEKYFYDQSTTNTTSNVKVLDLNDYNTNVIENANFEDGTNGWTIDTPLQTDGGANVINVNNAHSSEALGIEYLGSSLTTNNQTALALYSKNDKTTSIAYNSSNFDIKPFGLYKISVKAKVSSEFSGSAYFSVIENDDIEKFYGEDNNILDYTALSTNVTISSNEENALTNDYTTYTIYVRGHELYATTAHIQLAFGNSETGASGLVVFDDVRFETITPTEFENSSSTNSSKLTLTTLEGASDLSIQNGTFNIADTTAENYAYPVKPASWTHDSEKQSLSSYGIINTNKNIFDSSNLNFANPENPNSVSQIENEVNNVLYMHNTEETYQSVKSASFETSKNSIQKISFSYQTISQIKGQSKIFNVYVLDDEDNIVYAEENIVETGYRNYENYEIYIKNISYSTSLSLMLSLGTEKTPVSALAFIDNVEFETTTLTDEDYAIYADQNMVIDFNDNNFNIISESTINGMYTPYRYTQKLEAGEQTSQGDAIAYAGIIDGDTNSFNVNNSPNNESSMKYMPAFKTLGIATYSLTAKEKLTLEPSTYYKISIDILTDFVGDLSQDVDKDHEDYVRTGAIFALNGLTDSFNEIITNGEWTTYTFLVSVTTNTDVNLKMSIQNQNKNMTLGLAFFDNYQIETMEKLDFDKLIESKQDADNFLSIVDFVPEDDENTDTNNNNNNLKDNLMYIIPSAIMFLALAIAVATHFMKKIKIKKWERKRQNDYDRDTTLYRNVIRRDSEKIQRAKVKEYETQIAKVKEELKRIEEIHSEVLKEQRRTAGRTITREVEKSFKAYANKHTKLENEIAKIEAKIETTMSPEYLISVQKGIVAEKIKLENQSRKAEYDKIKQQKKQEKLNAKKKK